MAPLMRGEWPTNSFELEQLFLHRWGGRPLAALSSKFKIFGVSACATFVAPLRSQADGEGGSMVVLALVTFWLHALLACGRYLTLGSRPRWE